MVSRWQTRQKLTHTATNKGVIMNVKELITQLLNEEMEAGVFVVVESSDGIAHFAIDGITAFREYKGKSIYWRTVTLETTDA